MTVLAVAILGAAPIAAGRSAIPVRAAMSGAQRFFDIPEEIGGQGQAGRLGVRSPTPIARATSPRPAGTFFSLPGGLFAVVSSERRREALFENGCSAGYGGPGRLCRDALTH